MIFGVFLVLSGAFSLDQVATNCIASEQMAAGIFY